MKTLALSLLLVVGVARADDHWTTANTVLEAGFDALVLVDVMQTATPGWRENGPASGLLVVNGRVDRGRLLAVSASAVVLHAAVSAVLPRRWREVWQGMSLAVEGVNVAGNFSLGGRLTIPF